MSFQTYQEAVDWITGLRANGIKPGLMRMEYMMDRLDHPHRRLKFIHVAGTNGKGSTCAMLDQALRSAGYDVGRFTSPYLEKFTDRITFNGEPIPEEEVLRLTNRIKPLAEELAQTELGHPTMFEICTTLAILYFAEVSYPYYVVWETGLGGRLDSTNIVIPLVSVITNIGMDHTELLGDTPERIAYEKAGIIKPGVPVVTAVEQPEALRVIEEIAAVKKSTVYRFKKQYDFSVPSAESPEQMQAMDFVGPFREYIGLEVALQGAHQLKNAAVAVMTLEILRQYYALILEEEDLRAALAQVRWPGRLEQVSSEPRIVVDGAHNPEGAEVLAHALRQSYRYERLHIMAGMLASKEHRDYCRHILPLADTVIVTQPNIWGAKDAGELYDVIIDLKRDMGLDRLEVVLEPDWRHALERLKSVSGPQDLSIVTGSLYLVSDVRSMLFYQTESEKGW
jgi:folylpolyglutamate synthase/dihydrofolate synthase